MYLLFAIALSMLLVMLFSITEIEKWKSDRRVFLSLYLVGMMLTMNLGGYLWLAYHLFFVFIALNAGYMIGGLYAITMLGEIRKSIAYITFSILMVASEVIMGSLFYTLSNKVPATFNASVENPWFIGVMITEMLYTILISYRRMNRTLRNYLIGLLLLMPWFPDIFGVRVSTWVSSAVMIGVTVLIYETLYNNRLRGDQEVYTTIELIAIFTLMMAGDFVLFLTGSLEIFDLSMLGSMLWFIYRALSGPNPVKGNYMRNSKIAFTIVALTFVMEFFMGATLDFVQGVFAPTLRGFISSLTLPWIAAVNPVGVLWDFTDIVGSVLGSTWFLIMMGIEMGFLAFKKMMEMRVREVRIRMMLMIVAYALYSVYLPSFSPISSKIQLIPYMWSMGVGTLGPVTGAVLGGLIGTYVIYAVLSFLFGSRNLCAISCTAPLMYQGNFYDSLKVYNRSSSLGRKTLTSKLSSLYKAVALGVSLLVLISAVLSYLSGIKVISFSIFGTDITVLIYFIWFDVIWYVLFLSIPFLGTFSCVTSGYCYWGVFNQAVSRIGLFRLKVRDPKTCLNCKTVDCANACPVGLTDMRGEFLRKGEFRSMKCIGLGECVDACPYDNIFFYDVRNWVKEKFRG
ncbi:4Fe-4S ferredoxin [Sulfolobales archaeon HS-7]|nr:4Fe-4S ferredoxin [Sulfolobales archaeon HS-7]